MTEEGLGSGGTAKRVFGWLLIVFGGLWVLLTGGCTLAFLGMGLSEAKGGDMSVLLTFLGLGAVCILPGAALVYGGWVILRKPRR